MQAPTGALTLLTATPDASGREAQLPRTDDTLRETVNVVSELHGGRQVGGDVAMFAFPTTVGAVAAALELRQRLDEEQLAARVGVHVGVPRRHEDGLVRRDLLISRSIALLAQPRQVLLSESAARAAGPELPDGATLQEIGRHELAGLGPAIALFELVTAAVPAAVAKAVEPVALGGALPVVMTPTVGRDGELAELIDLMHNQSVRLVTLTGPGGTGKTRLATELAVRLNGLSPEPTYFVPLATVARAADMWPAIGQGMGIPAAGQIPPELFEYVTDRRALLVLDNLEQIDEAGKVVSELLASAPHIRVIATSRRALRIAGEYRHEVPPLTLPAPTARDGADLRSSGAVQLFVSAAVRVNDSFELTAENQDDVVAICTALDGLPLAIELAAARSRLLTPRALLQRLGDALDLASRNTDQPHRQRTLRETIDWSYRLLTQPQQWVLRRLGVFVGGARLDAVEEVCSPPNGEDVLDVLEDLVDASLVKVANGYAEPRFELLETIRHYILDIIEPGELQDIRAAHAQFYYDLAKDRRQTAPRNSTLSLAVWGGIATDLDAEMGNLAAVLRNVPVHVVDTAYESGLVPAQHVAALFADLARRSAWPYTEIEAWTELALGPDFVRDTLGTLACLAIQALAGRALERYDRVELLCNEAEHLLSERGDAGLPPTGYEWVDPTHAICLVLYVRATSFLYAGRVDEARAHLLRLKERAGQIPTWEYQYASGLSWVAALQGEHDEGIALQEEAIAIARAHGTAEDVLSAESNLADSLIRKGDRTSAQTLLQGTIPATLGAKIVIPELVERSASNLALSMGSSEPRLTARLWGSLSSYRSDHGLHYGEFAREDDEALLRETKAMLTPTEWDQAYEQGQAEPLEELVLEVLDPG